MIDGYSIKNINGEEVLYVYLDFNYEFGSFKKDKENIKKRIKEFIEKNKIAFKGTVIAIVVGGMVTGSMKLDKPAISNSIDNNKMVLSEQMDNDLMNYGIINTGDTLDFSVAEENTSSTIDNNDKTETEVIEVKEIPITESIKEEVKKVVESNDEEVNPIIEEKNDEINRRENESDSQSVVDISSNEEIEEVIENNKIFVNIYRSNGQVLNLELEEYIVGVVGAEMPASFNIEALKAQAIIARTYALKAITTGKNLTDNESTQSFKDNDQLRNIWGSSFDTYYNKIKDAVYSTEGMYLTYNGYYIEAVYHSTSNGITENAENVWGNFFPYLVSVESTYDNLNPSFRYEKTISFDELSNKLGINVDVNTNFNIISKTSGNRVENIVIDGINFKGTKLRGLLGLRSTDFDIVMHDDSVTFITRGYGHGVGMSQYGANGMAKNGYNYKEILMHYYPGTNLNCFY